MTYSPEDYELFHFGVKGMKWGVRKEDKKATPRKTIRQRIKDRDEKIQTARDNRDDVFVKEAEAIKNSLQAKGRLLKNLRDPDRVEDVKNTSKLRRRATADRVINEKIANKKNSKEIALRGVAYTIPILASAAYIGAGAAGTHRNAKIGERLKNDMFADTHGLPAPGIIALQFIDGKWQ